MGCRVRCRFRVFWGAEFESFEILTIGVIVREIWGLNCDFKMSKGGTLIDFWIKKFFFLFSTENAVGRSENVF